MGPLYVPNRDGAPPLRASTPLNRGPVALLWMELRALSNEDHANLSTTVCETVLLYSLFVCHFLFAFRMFILVVIANKSFI